MRSRAALRGAVFIFCSLVLMLFSSMAPTLAFAAAAPLAPHDGGLLNVHIQQLVPNGINQLEAYVSVIGADGHPVAGLTADQVTATVDGQRLPIGDLNEVTDVGQPITAAVLLDTSTTMGYDDKLPDAKAAISAFGQSLNAQDQVAFYQIAGDGPAGVKRLLNFTTDHAKLSATVNPLPPPAGPGVRAPIYDALYQVAQDMAALPGRKLVVIQTDMHDDSSIHSLDQALNLLQQVHLPVYTIGLGTDADLATLQHISQTTGGTSFDYTDAASLSASYQTILSQFRDSYRLILQTPGAFAVGKHQVQVQVNYQGQPYTDTANFVVPSTALSLRFSLHTNDQVVGSANLGLDVLGDDLPIKLVTVTIDGKSFASIHGAGPHYALPTWNVRYVWPGTHTIQVTATDIEGNRTSVNVQVKVGVEWPYWIGLLIELLLLLAALIVLRYAYYRFLGGKLEGTLFIYNSAGQQARILLDEDVHGSRMRLKIRPEGVFIGAHPPLKKFPFEGEATSQASKSREGRKVRALLYTEKRRLQQGSKRVTVPYYYQREKKKPLELNNGKMKSAGQYKVKFTEE